MSYEGKSQSIKAALMVSQRAFHSFSSRFLLLRLQKSHMLNQKYRLTKHFFKVSIYCL